MLGVGLLALALWYVSRNKETVTRAVDALRTPDPFAVAVILLSVVGNIVLTAAIMRTLLRRFGQVGVMEMQALIATASLFNYLPLRPGLIGRVGYHKRFNNIAIRDSLRVVVETIALGAMWVGWVVLALLASFVWEGATMPLIVAPVVALPFGMLAPPAWRIWVIAALIRYVDLLVTAARYYYIFEVLDAPIGFDSCTILAGLSLSATLIPLLSNGLGLREWLTAFVAPALEPALTNDLALTADLVHRAGEVLVVAVVGLAGVAWVTHHLHRQTSFLKIERETEHELDAEDGVPPTGE